MRSIPLPTPDSLSIFATLLNVVPVGLAFCDREFRCIRVNEVLAAINGRSSQVTTKRVELAALVEISDNMRFLGDAGRIRQVLLNLAGNAVKFTEAGAVTIRAYIAYGFDLPDHSLIRFDISDSGIGIAPDVLDRLFQPFAQADGSTTRRYGGTGLGLAISKRLAEMLGGQIGAQSVAGAGSAF